MIPREPSAPSSKAPSRGFLREFLIASAVHLLCLLWVFRAPLLGGKVDSAQQSPTQIPQALYEMSEMVYEVQPALFVQSDLVRGGVFPSWSPLSQGGAPLIGKMQNAVFAPHHLPLYLFPRSWMPYLFMLIQALKAYLAFAFAYLYARSLRLNMFSGIFAGTCFVFMELLSYQLFAPGGSGLFLPLLLALIELHFQGRKGLVRFLLPWAAGLPFFAGHFEGAFMVDFAAAVYFLARLVKDEAADRRGKIRDLAAFCGLMLLGVGLAAVQIGPAVEYFRHSFNMVWHSPGFLGWEYETINKRLSFEDLPLLALGLGGAASFYLALRGCLRCSEHPLAPRAVARMGLAGASLALSIACLAQLGLNDSLDSLTFRQSGWPWGLSFPLIGLACWGFGRTREPGMRILGWLMIVGMLVMLKTPVLANALLHLPLFEHFHNASRRWEFQLAVSVLSAWSLEHAWALTRQPASRRLGEALRALSILCVFLCGYAGSQAVKETVARRAQTSLPGSARDRTLGGIMGPQRQSLYGRAWSVAGWIPSEPPTASITVGLLKDKTVVATGEVGARAAAAARRIRFDATVPVPSTVREDDLQAFALVKQADGRERTLLGTLIHVRDRGGVEPWMVAGCLLALPLLLLTGRRLLGASYVVLMVALLQFKSQPLGESSIPYRLPGIQRIGQDTSLYRACALQYKFLQADYLNVYGLADIRTGGDNLDVLSMIYFFELAQKAGGFIGDARDPASFDVGLKLLGLANVKYLLGMPAIAISHPQVESLYRGPDMDVYLNRRFKPRAVFYDRYLHHPVGDWGDWSSRGRLLAPLADRIRRGLDFDKTLVLNDPPAHGSVDARQGLPSRASVVIEEYSPGKVRLTVETARAGFVFLSDTHFPGWNALLNGQKAPILRSWLNFRAVEVPAGRSVVEFDYDPIPLKLGAAVTIALILAWLTCYLSYRRRRLMGGETPPDSSVAGCALLTEAMVLAAVGPPVLFWIYWSGFVYHGGIQRLAHGGGQGLGVNVAACLILSALTAALYGFATARRSAAASGG